MSITNRTILRRYADPLDAVWVITAKRIGLAIERSDEVYASTTGDGVLTIGEKATSMKMIA